MGHFFSTDRVRRILALLTGLVAFMFTILGLLLLSNVLKKWMPGNVAQLVLGAFLLGGGAVLALAYDAWLYRGGRRGEGK